MTELVRVSLPAGAPSSSCPDGWSQVGSTSICEKTVVSDGTISIPAGVGKVDALVVGGGGGGGGSAGRNVPGSWAYGGGGGGGGGAVKVCIDLQVSGSISVTIGSGGSGGSGSHTLSGPTQGDSGSDGGSSSAGSCEAAGGYGGTAGIINATSTAGFGIGGASGSGNPGGTAPFGSITCIPAEVTPCLSTGRGSGGGGGDSANGTNGSNGSPGNGGAGSTPSNGLFAGATESYGGGGGGASQSANGTGGAGGGGDSGQTSPAEYPADGAANTGGGGGGAINFYNDSTAPSGGDGGSGVVVLRFDLNDVEVATSTAAAVSDAVIDLGETVSDTATVTASTGSTDPTGTVQFYFCRTEAESAPPTSCDAASGTAIGEPVTLVSTGTAGVAEAVLANWEPALAGNYLLHAAFTGSAPFGDSADDGTNQSLSVVDAPPPTTAPPAVNPRLHPDHYLFDRRTAPSPSTSAPRYRPSKDEIDADDNPPAFFFGIALIIGDADEDVPSDGDKGSRPDDDGASRSTVFWILIGCLVGYVASISQYVWMSRRTIRRARSGF